MTTRSGAKSGDQIPCHQHNGGAGPAALRARGADARHVESPAHRRHLRRRRGGQRARSHLELVEGATLAERIAASGRTAGSNAPGLPMAEALPIARQIVEALEDAHEKGVVHRDLKPANIEISPEGTVKVLDFGPAKGPRPRVARSDLRPSRADSPGTPAYMTPEQARGTTSTGALISGHSAGAVRDVDRARGVRG